MSKHTPGPWRIESDQSHFDSISSVRGGSSERRMGLADELMVEVGGWSRDQEANTRIIAAAPDLLEALRELIAEAEEGIATSPLTRKKARAAIAKATGVTA